MKLKLLDIERFIERNNIKEVTSSKSHLGGGRETVDPKGLFSEEIFGRTGSRQRKNTFGFVNLNATVIHPNVYPIFTSLNTDLTKLILEKGSYKIENGELLSDEEGGSGIIFFIENFDKIDFSKLIEKDKAKKEKSVEFIKNNKDKVFINKFLILPAGIRDIQISRTTGKAMIQYADIVNMYQRLIQQASHIVPDSPPEIAEFSIKNIQRLVLDINNWIKDQIKGKRGIIRGGILKKVTDYSARMVITPDPKLKLGYVGVPWQIVLKLFEPFTLNYLTKKDDSGMPLIKKYMKIEGHMDFNDLKRFLSRINSDPDTVVGELERYLINVAKEITKDRVLVYKRDPAENRDSWISAYIRVDEKGHVFKTNSLDLNKNGGDYDGDAVSVFSVLTEEAQEQAKRTMNPRHSKSTWVPTSNAGKISYGLTLDASTAVYAATKE